MLKNKLKVDDRFLFNPVFIVLAGHLIIFLLAVPYFNKFNPVLILKMFFIVLTYIASFSIPFFTNIGTNIKREFIIYLSGSLIFFLIFYGVMAVSDSLILAIIYPLAVLGIIHLFVATYPSKKMDNVIFFVGIFSFILIVVQNGAIPILDYTTRMDIAADPLRLISSGALTYGGLSGVPYFLVAFVLLILLGYKANVLILLAAFLIYQYGKGRISPKHIILYGFASVLLLGIMAKLILLSSGQSWKLNFIEILSYRAYFDLMTLDRIINYPELLLGKVSFNPNGESLIGNIIFNYSHNITSTMFGPIYLDFGIFGVIFAFLLGLISKLIYTKGDIRIYSIYGATLLSMCEIGINYGFLITLFVILYVVILQLCDTHT
ncbi:MAG: hypothetical protein PWP15_137 [Methanothermococcus sp.]|jgi:uncharacterized membrane protein|uniref:hypothetical protein n=1 Tax=Methanothermococcus TaxID=155862 RepID=UPI00035C9BBC|nr:MULTISPECIES: hypothetical protein [Methanothermococcus]MDK2789630.1 hypothetical protein [Methanothermococcus sp.]MDK2988072.1 hypothetical protein [Methanothermococcus sp.]